jgi:hypothetical protein
MGKGYHEGLAARPCRWKHPHRHDSHCHYCAFCGEHIEQAAAFDEVCGHWTNHAFGWCGRCDKERCRDDHGASPYNRAALTAIKDWPQHICGYCRVSYGCLWCAAFGAEQKISELEAWCGGCGEELSIIDEVFGQGREPAPPSSDESAPKRGSADNRPKRKCD